MTLTTRVVAPRLCVPVTDVFRSRRATLLPLADAMTFKEPTAEVFPGKAHFLECSYYLADTHFSEQLERSGLLAALRSGKYESFACDIGPNCGFEIGRSPNGFPWAMPTTAPIADAVYLARAARNADWLRAQFAGYVQVENLNYFPTGAYERVCEPDFITQLIAATQVGLLLDIGHAIISARNLGYADAISYIDALPLAHVREVHVSRPGLLHGVMEDLHDPPDEAELALIDHVVKCAPAVQYLTIEYYRDADVLCEVYRSLAGRDRN